MKGDFSRLTFDPRRGYAGVYRQQGRVELDADWNEAADIARRRERLSVVDALGRCAISRLTPDAFRIAIDDAGSLTIAPGRIYVDGLLAECFGEGRERVDPILGELVGSEPVAYERQPFVPQPEPLPSPPYVVYLDVWERSVTAAEDPSLVEPALGVDTSARLQTVWQVKVVGGTVSLDELDAGRGTLSATLGKGGYAGTENRLYRVEVHDPGSMGKATFTWSRNNGALAAGVVAIGSDRRTLHLRVLGDGPPFRTGEMIELLDERHELGARPGILARVERWALPELILAEPVTEEPDVALRPRVRVWDGYGSVTQGWVALEDGVEVSFGGDGFRTGDWWTFPARTVGPEVEQPTDAPPRGIHHHRCLLATVSSEGRVEDAHGRPPEDPQTAG